MKKSVANLLPKLVLVLGLVLSTYLFSLEEEVLYCVEEKGSGFTFKEGSGYVPGRAALRKFPLKVYQGEIAGELKTWVKVPPKVPGTYKLDSESFDCEESFDIRENIDEGWFCVSDFATLSINFQTGNFIFTETMGNVSRDVNGKNTSIDDAYLTMGTCSKF